jgi:hypothetical protein
MRALRVGRMVGGSCLGIERSRRKTTEFVFSGVPQLRLKTTGYWLEFYGHEVKVLEKNQD